MTKTWDMLGYGFPLSESSHQHAKFSGLMPSIVQYPLQPKNVFIKSNCTHLYSTLFRM